MMAFGTNERRTLRSSRASAAALEAQGFKALRADAKDYHDDLVLETF
jgi:hypothetical protein